MYAFAPTAVVLYRVDTRRAPIAMDSRGAAAATLADAGVFLDSILHVLEVMLPTGEISAPDSHFMLSPRILTDSGLQLYVPTTASQPSRSSFTSSPLLTQMQLSLLQGR